MINFEQWEGFEGRIWKEEVNVRDFIQKNYTPYDGDESFLAGPTEATDKLWGALQKLQKEERAKGGVLDMETEVVSGLTAYGPGYIDETLKDLEQIVGLQTDKPLKRALHVNGGIRIACQAAAQHGYEVDPEVVDIYTNKRKTHNQGVFDVYKPEMRACRSAHIITGLPDGYGRGRIIGDYRRVALYGVDFLIRDKEAQKAATPSTMTEAVIRDREELADQIRALQGADLVGELLAVADDGLGHGARRRGLLRLLIADEEVHAVERHAAVVADDAATAVAVGQAGDDMGGAAGAHLGLVDVEHALVVRLTLVGVDVHDLGVDLVAVLRGGLAGDADAAVHVQGALEGLIGLQADDLLQILQGLVDIAGAVSSQAADDFGLHVQHAALGALFLLQLLQGTPQLIGRLGGASQKAFVSVVRGVVLLDEVADIDFLFPDAALKAFPLFKIDHWNLLAPFHARVSAF